MAPNTKEKLNTANLRGKVTNKFLTNLGKYEWPNGEVYNGQWRQGEMDGEGEFKWTNGDSYKGSYSRGKRSGFGHFQWYRFLLLNFLGMMEMCILEGGWMGNSMASPNSQF